MGEKHNISVFAEKLTICKLDKDADVPAWALHHAFVCITRTEEELSLVAPEALVPAHLPHDRGWQGFKVEGPLDLTLYGVLAALITPLAQAGISVLAIATFDTDYFLVKETQVEQAVALLCQEGYHVSLRS